ncbi:(4Fe-4S)-binding protein [Lutimonas zeaxanthinifaciens]|uniref:(4Fe-4S)-binding protein n=1 Tax=Lutimonas zeaxanthinifaciens TaxID=3060215 RepID=UPI00265CCF8D|nr:(4Fe-4S)-binding protein [Lutimonas sp. YSD2104]WKK64645.1 (4Fe-4S)-binding protein [Lutimonas sp. YSD2104]
MDKKDIIKKYKRDNLTINWQAGKCIHSAVCVKELPGVYDPKSRPWIKPENASVEELKDQIDKCPSGALSYDLEDAVKGDPASQTEVELMENGPLLVKGSIQIKSPDGSVVNKEKLTAFCRCGGSNNKPYCDGQHKKIGFQG